MSERSGGERVLVTWGTGVFGAFVLRDLLAADIDVRVATSATSRATTCAPGFQIAPRRSSGAA